MMFRLLFMLLLLLLLVLFQNTNTNFKAIIFSTLLSCVIGMFVHASSCVYVHMYGCTNVYINENPKVNSSPFISIQERD